MMWAAAAVRSGATMSSSSTAKTRAASGRITPRLSAMIVMAESAGAHIALAARRCVPASSAIVSLNRMR